MACHERTCVQCAETAEVGRDPLPNHFKSGVCWHLTHIDVPIDIFSLRSKEGGSRARQNVVLLLSERTSHSSGFGVETGAHIGSIAWNECHSKIQVGFVPIDDWFNCEFVRNVRAKFGRQCERLWRYGGALFIIIIIIISTSSFSQHWFRGRRCRRSGRRRRRRRSLSIRFFFGRSSGSCPLIVIIKRIKCIKCSFKCSECSFKCSEFRFFVFSSWRWCQWTSGCRRVAIECGEADTCASRRRRRWTRCASAQVCDLRVH